MPTKGTRRAKKSSSKKSHVVYSSTDTVVKSDLLDINFDKYVIIHLSVKKEDLNKPLGPAPYAPDMMDFALIESKSEELDKKSKVDVPEVEGDIEYSESVSEVRNGLFVVKKNIINVMYEFIDSNRKKCWPSKVNINCTWCCAPFDTPPCAIPIKYVRNIFYLKDNFCSFNCAAAQIFDNKDDDMWEQYALLNLLYKKMFNKNFVKIKRARSKRMLKEYGGTWTIEQFRSASICNDNLYKFVFPPMVAVIPKLEEDIVDLNRKYDNYIPVDTAAIKEAETTMRLKREKPVIDKGKTLLAFMEIKSA